VTVGFFTVKIASPIHFGFLSAPRRSSDMTTPWHTLPGPLRPDIFETQAVRFGTKVTPLTGTVIKIWLRLLESLGPNPPTDKQKTKIARTTGILMKLLSHRKEANNHILASIELYGDTDRNPYRAVAQSPEAREIASRITERQLQIMELSSLGWTQATIAKAFGISPGSVATIIFKGQKYQSLFDNLGVRNMFAALSLATRHGLLSNRTLSDFTAIQRIEALTLPQLRVLELALSDITPKQIGVTLGIELKTVRNYANAIYKLLLPNQIGSRRILITQYYDYLDDIRRLIEEKSTK